MPKRARSQSSDLQIEEAQASLSVTDVPAVPATNIVALATEKEVNTMSNGTDNGAGGFRVNLGAIPEQREVSDGQHVVVITYAKPGTSQAGLPKMDLRYKVEESDDDANVDQTVFDILSFAPKALFRVGALLRAIGLPKDFDEEVTSDLLMGSRMVITTAIEESTGINEQTGEPYRPRARVKAYAPIGANTPLGAVLARR